jgi:hypothetical protein
MAFPFPTLITHNLRWKLVALLTAVLVWLAISGGDGELRSANHRTIANRTLAVMTLPSDNRVFRLEPAQVELRVSGPVRRIYNLGDSDVQVFVNLADASFLGSQPVRVQASVPPGILIDSISPSEVVVRVLTNRLDHLPSVRGR